ncbi:hypothetical protein ONZ51_g11698 [Trametes cubensis]|uniref:Uncharacterized protein n=1 Tax=Trametes cubensis TaxID=1111947 RepID=A0AAD7X641_9APHY|nr:hypothetical protein ONZ51_g11698 [Trametes cubensis]
MLDCNDNEISLALHESPMDLSHRCVLAAMEAMRNPNAGVMGAGGPAHAVHFGAYELVMEFTGGNVEGANNEWIAMSRTRPHLYIVAGGLVGAAAGAVMTPPGVAKIILQTRGTSIDPEMRHCRGLADAFRTLWAEGLARVIEHGIPSPVYTNEERYYRSYGVVSKIAFRGRIFDAARPPPYGASYVQENSESERAIEQRY